VPCLSVALVLMLPVTKGNALVKLFVRTVTTFTKIIRVDQSYVFLNLIIY